MKIGMISELLSARRRLRVREHWTRQQLESYQTEAVRRLRQYAYAHSPFYREFHKRLYEAPLCDLPVLTKGTLMDHFDDLVTDRAVHLQNAKSYVASQQPDERFLGRYWVQSTSGTSGLPGLFVYNRSEWFAMLAAALRAFQAAGVNFRFTHRTKMAQITSTNPSHMSAQGATTTRNWWMPVMLLSATEPLTAMVERLNAYQPEVLLAYASILRILADEQTDGRLRIAPRVVISGSEVLTRETRRRGVSAWGNVLFDMYGTTDCGGIAAECNQHRGMHFQEDLAIIEVVGCDNRPVPTGEYGDKLLVTVFGSRTQPLIRYELEDSLRLLPDRCPCGRPFKLIGDVQGRVHEVLVFPGMAGGSVKVHPIIFHNIMDTLPVRGWQVLQETDGLHLLLADVRGTVNESELVDVVRQALTKQEAVVPLVAVQQINAIPQASSGKTPLVKSNLPHIN